MNDNTKEEDGSILRKVLELTLKNGRYDSGINSDAKIVEFLPPEKLRKLIDFDIAQEGAANKSEVKDMIDLVVRYSLNTQHPHFYNQLYGGVDEIGLASAWLLESLNTNAHTFEVSPVFTLAENYILKFLIKKFGWDVGDGIFAPGGSMSNMYGIILARFKYYPQFKDTGMFGHKPLAILTSDMSHYSVDKIASCMGIGMKNVISVKSDDNGKMSVSNLKAAIDKARLEGKEPFCVVATTGTTVFGSFDPVENIAPLCKKENLWLHVDACWGGVAILSSKHKHLLAGVESADSISWNPHKFLCVPLQCSVFIVRHKTLLNDYNKIGATYLFQQDKIYPVEWDNGDKGLQCGRKPDAFKLWYTLKMHGLKKIESSIDKAFEAVDYLKELISNRNDFRLVVKDRKCINICFWYIPPSLQEQEENSSWWKKLHLIAPKIKARMVTKGSLMIGYQPMEVKNLPNFFRMVVHCVPEPTKADMVFIVDEIEALGKDL